MDEQHNNPEQHYQPETPAPEYQEQPSPFEQYVPEPPTPPVIEEVAPVIETAAPGAQVSGHSASKRKSLVRVVVGVVVLTVVGVLASTMMGSSEPTAANVVAPIVPPAAPIAPIAAPVAPVAPAPMPNYSPCEQKMADFAVQNGADPKEYIAQNQAWLTQCNQAENAAKAN